MVDERTGRRGLRRLVVIAVLAAVASSTLRDRDSFPLSTYPMYATARGEIVDLATAVGFDATGIELRLSMATIAETDDPLIAESRVDRAIAAGRAGELCAEIAARAHGRGVVTVEVVEERHDVVARTEGRASLLERTVHARCAAPS
jgi:hypothetical protein